MPRRNHKGRCQPDPDQLAAGINAVTVVAVADAKYPCAGCNRRGYWTGEFCPACIGRIILSARTHATGEAVTYS
jgi:hypothetical protein